MKKLALAILLIIPLLTLGCGVSKADYDQLQTKYNDLLLVNNTLDKQNNALMSRVNELSDNQYNLRNFPNPETLKDFVKKYKNNISDGSGMAKIYSATLKMQQDAMKEGYLISAVIARGQNYYVNNRDSYTIYCIAIVTGYGLYKWYVNELDVFVYLSWADLNNY